MQNPIDLTDAFRREMQKRQRRAIITSLIDTAARLGAFLFGLSLMCAIGVAAADIAFAPNIIFLAFAALAIWGIWGMHRLFCK